MTRLRNVAAQLVGAQQVRGAGRQQLGGDQRLGIVGRDERSQDRSEDEREQDEPGERARPPQERGVATQNGHQAVAQPRRMRGSRKP
jgi:hypothetical protein